MNSVIAKKLFAGVAVFSMLAVSAPAFAAAHAEGTNVNKAGTIGMIIGGQFRPYTSAGAFLSYGFNSWSTVVEANADDSALPVGSFIPPQDGSIIFSDRGADKGTGYVISGGSKYGFPTEAIFKGQGYSYANAMWADVSWMPMGGVINSADAAHLPGTLVNNGGTVQLVGNTGLMGVPDLATFNSWGYSFAKVVPANSNDKAKSQTGVMATRQAGQLSPVSVTTTPTGPFSAMVSSDNPASTTLVAGQSTADLAHFTVSGNGTVNSFTFKRIGVSANTTPSNVYLFEGSNRLTDAASFNSDNKVVFAGLNWNVSGSRAISVRSDIASSAAGQTVGVQLAQVNGADLSSMPSGNIHSIASASLATVAMSNAQTISDFDPGVDITVFQGTATVGTRDVTLSRLALRQIGSIIPSDVKNFRLYVDGVQVASAASLDSNGYVTFSASTTLKTGARILKVVADVIGGSGRNIQMSLRGSYDITTMDTSYNVPVLATGTFPFGDSTTASINTGTLTVQKTSDSASSNVVSGASDQSLGKFSFTAFGEAVKVETLRVGMLGTTSGTITDHTLRNVRVLVNGSQVGSTTDVPFAASFAAASGTSFTTNFTVNPGSPATVEIRGDIYDSEGTEEISTGVLTAIQAVLVGGSATNNGVPQVSLGTINVPSATNVSANSLTVGASTISLAAQTTYPSQNTTAPQSSFKLGSFVLTGSSTEAVNVHTIDVGFVGGDTFDPSDDLSNVFLKINGTATNQKASVTDGTSTNLATSWSVNVPLAINETKTVEVWGTIGSSITAAGSNDTMTTYMRATGTTAVSGTTVYADTDTDTDNTDAGKTGQTITIEAGSITATVDASAPSAALVDDSGTVTSAAYKVAAVTDSYTITDITLTLGSATAVSTVTIKDGSTTVASKPAATSLTFSGLNVAVAANTNKVLTVELTMSPIGVAAGTTDSDLTTTLTAFTARNSSGTSAAGTESNPAGNVMYAYKAIPTVTAQTVPTSALAGGEMVLAKFTVSSGGTGTIAWKQALFEITKSAAPTISSPTLYNSDTGVQVNATLAFQNGTAGVATTCVADNTFCELLVTVDADSTGAAADDDYVEQISGAKTYEVRASIGGTLASGNFITTKLDRNTTSHAASAVFTTNDNAGTAGSVSFVWSDESNAETSNTGVATWQKDYLVKNLPMTWSLNRS